MHYLWLILFIMSCLIGGNLGICILGEVYTLKGRLQIPESFGFIFVIRFHDRYDVYSVRRKYTFNLTHCPVGYRLIYMDNKNKKIPIPYESGVPFRVKNGTLIYQRATRRGFSFSYQEVCRSHIWPIEDNSLTHL